MRRVLSRPRLLETPVDKATPGASVCLTVVDVAKGGLRKPPGRIPFDIGLVVGARRLGSPKETLQLVSWPRRIALAEVVELRRWQPLPRWVRRQDVLHELFRQSNAVCRQVVGQTLRPAEDPIGELSGSVVAPTEAAR